MYSRSMAAAPLATAREARLLFGIDSTTSHQYKLDVSRTTKRGLDVLKDPLLNKGTAFTIAERERLRIRGLLPPRVQTMRQQIQRNFDYIEGDRALLNDNQRRKEWSDMQLYKDLCALQDRNETLYYRLLMDDFEKLAPIIYTPTVGQACLKSHAIYRQARGMYFSTQDRGHFASMTYNWPHDVQIIVVTDGSRVLGLGDLGVNGMPISVGKLSLYVSAGGIPPEGVLPVVLDVGTNNESLRNNPLYLGVPEPRLEGEDYYNFLDEWLHAIYSRWPRALVQFEDFKNPHAQELLNKYRDRFCCFNDDIQSTGAIALAGVLSSLKARGLNYTDLANEKIVCVGAGSAGIGVCETIVEAMILSGVVATKEEACSKFYLFDNNGLLGDGRTSLTPQQARFQRTDLPAGMKTVDVIHAVKPTILLGLSGAGGAFTEDIVRAMGDYNAQPVIFPLSNPTNNSECSAEQAFHWTNGRCLFASGTPFVDVESNGRTFRTSQCNNYYIFPGIGLGVTTCLSSTVPDRYFQEAAKIIADQSKYHETGRLYPEVHSIRDISLDIAVRVCELAEEMGLANRKPQRGMSWRDFIVSRMWYPRWYQTIVAS
ncbi:Malic enzyme [Globomyces sp. JEL0801]|nr:Malic enzyme [Globomyces sp. JEL0801]